MHHLEGSAARYLGNSAAAELLYAIDIVPHGHCKLKQWDPQWCYEMEAAPGKLLTPVERIFSIPATRGLGPAAEDTLAPQVLLFEEGPECSLCSWANNSAGVENVNCCHPDGAWEGQCAQQPNGTNATHRFSFTDGFWACKRASKNVWEAALVRKAEAARRKERKLQWHGPPCPLCAWSNNSAGVENVNCCHQGAGWEGQCAATRNATHNFTYTDGYRACKRASKKAWREALRRKERMSQWQGPKCSLCAWANNSKGVANINCCHEGGGWEGQCAETRNATHNFTYIVGYQACKQRAGSSPKLWWELLRRKTEAARREARKARVVEWHGPPCPRCAWSTSGSKDGTDTANCCHLGGGWEGRCANQRDRRRNFTYLHGYLACQDANATLWQEYVERPWTGTKCSLCAWPTNTRGRRSEGTSNCCHQGGAWQGHCAARRTAKSNFTYLDGYRACKNADKKVWLAAVSRYMTWKTRPGASKAKGKGLGKRSRKNPRLGLGRQRAEHEAAERKDSAA
jgi:hypothetical protein